jgi:hypothetical protein
MSAATSLKFAGYWRFSVSPRDQITAMTQTTSSDITQFNQMKDRVKSYLMGQQPVAERFAPSLKVLDELRIR